MADFGVSAPANGGRAVATFVRWFNLARVVGLIMLAGLLALRVWDPGLLEITRLKTFDIYQSLKPRVPTQYPAIIVDIDEKSLKTYGQWPWSRSLVAELITQITNAGGVAIAFDMIFAEKDRLSPRLVAESLKQIDEKTRQELRLLPDNEHYMIAALKKSRVVLGQVGHPQAGIQEGHENPQRATFAILGGDPDAFLLEFPGLLQNLPEVEAASSGQGLITLRPESDGIVRRVPAVMKAAGRRAPSLAIELLRVATGSQTILIKSDEAGVRSIVVGGVEIATDRHAQLWPYFSHSQKQRFVSAGDVIEGRVGRERLQGKLVLVGTSAVGLFDLRATPTEHGVPGVEVHAQLLENILSGTLLNRPHYSIGAELCIAALVSFIVIVLVPVMGALRVVVLGAIIAAVLIAASWYLFVSEKLLFDVVFPLTSSLAIFVVLGFVNYFREESRRNQVRNAFGQYLSPELVAQLTQDPDRLVLGGETREMTVLFSDVRGFTSIAELYKDNPAGLTSLMNRLLTPLSNAIIEKRGTIDKYMGDAIMAFWNAPLDDALHAKHGCLAALDMVVRLDALNDERRNEAEKEGNLFVPMHVGIGIATGASVVGNMGSDLRFDYSVLGDTVNLASRLEGLSSIYGVKVLVAGATAAAVISDLAVIEIDTVRVKGKHQPEVIFAIVGDEKLAKGKDFQAFRQSFGEMLDKYRGCSWDAALDMLRQLQVKGDKFDAVPLIATYRARILEFQKNPPPEDWDKVYAFDRK